MSSILSSSRFGAASITAEFQCLALVILVVDVVRIGPGGMQW
jgi:hypothetical protein